MESVTDLFPKLYEEPADPEGHHFIALHSEIHLPGTSYQYRYSIQLCTICGLVQRGPWFEQADGPAPLFAFYQPGKPPLDGGWGLNKRPPCPPHCHKCLKTMDQGAPGLINDGDDGLGPPVCCDCYESGVEPESPV